MDVDVLVIGAGAVGLAIAAEFARSGRDVIVLEACDGIGTQTSSRNSEVIHGGMYYPTDSLRHRMCVAGRRKLYDYLEVRGVPHLKRGKLIVATSDSETRKIEAIHATGLTNGVEKLELVSGAKAMAWEPALTCTAALWSPETGVVDSHGYMLALQGEIEDHGGMLAFNTPVVRIEPLNSGGFRVTTGGVEAGVITCQRLVNSAGLYAQRVAGGIEGYRADLIPKLVLAKGNYFGCSGKPAFSRLIYPAPVDGGLGVHVTLDLAGRMRFGPDENGCRMQIRTLSTIASIPLGRLRSMTLSAATGRACRTTRSRRTIRVVAPRFQGRASRRRISVSMGLSCMGMRGW